MASTPLFLRCILGVIISSLLSPACASDRISIVNYHLPGQSVDQSGSSDVSSSLSDAILEANARSLKGLTSCVYLPAGTYRISKSPPPFVGPGCIVGDGPTQTIITIDRLFSGDLFAWSEAWANTKPGPSVAGITIKGDRSSTNMQNALVFYDRNDQVDISNVNIFDLSGRAIYMGISRYTKEAYAREARMRSIRLFNVGAPDVTVVEINSQGSVKSDASNEIRMDQVDIFGSRGPSFIIRNNSSNPVRYITITGLRIEGRQDGSTPGDLLTIGDPTLKGNVNNISISDLSLINPSKGNAALRITAAPGADVPYQLSIQGRIDGGLPFGKGLQIEAARTSTFRFSGIHTFDTNVVVGKRVRGIVLDGGGQELKWSYRMHPSARNNIFYPVLRNFESLPMD